MTGILINIKEHKVENEFEMVKTVVRFLSVIKKITLSETEIFALSYFIIKGYNKITREELVSTKLLRTKNAVANLVTTLRKCGIIIKTIKGEELIEDFRFYQPNLDAIKFQVIIKK